MEHKASTWLCAYALHTSKSDTAMESWTSAGGQNRHLLPPGNWD